MAVDKFSPMALPTDHDNDESYLIAASTDYQLGGDGGQRLVTFNLDDQTVTIYEAVSGTHRYPPGRMMGVSLSAKEFEEMLTIYQARKVRKEEEAAADKAAAEAYTKYQKDDFDPFLAAEDLP